MMSTSEVSTSTESFETNNNMQKSDITSKILIEGALVSVKEIGTDFTFKHKIVWQNAIGFLILHLVALYGVVLLFTGNIGLRSYLWTVFIGYVSTEGVTIGAHRYYTHKSFKATPILRAIIILTHTIAGQILLCFVHHAGNSAPHLDTSVFLTLNGTWLVNSAAHLYGTRPYDRYLQAVETWFVSFISLGEGWHNYHHASYPWDYKAAELSERFNFSADIIKFLEKIGLAYDLKTVDKEIIRSRILRCGDGTHYELGNDEARACVSAVGPLHPLNPSYNVTYPPPSATLRREGLPLFHENDVIKLDKSTNMDSNRRSNIGKYKLFRNLFY